MSKKQTIYIFFVKICLSFQNLFIKVTIGFDLCWCIKWREGWIQTIMYALGHFFISSPELKGLVNVSDRNFPMSVIVVVVVIVIVVVVNFHNFVFF